MSDVKFTVGAEARQAISEFQKVTNEAKKMAAESAKAGGALAGGLKTGANQATNALTNLGRVIQDAPFGFIGIANNINPLLESFQRLKLETGSTKLAFSSLASSMIGPAGLGIAVSIASSLLTVFAQNALAKSGDEAEKAEKKVKKYAEILQEIIASAAKEATEVTSLIAVLKSETETRDRKLAAIEELKKIQPEVFNGLKLEKDAVVGLDDAYKSYLLNFKNVIAAKLIQVEIEKKLTRVLELQGATQTKQQNDASAALRKYVDSLQNARNLIVAPAEKGTTIFQQQESEVKALEAEIQELIKRLSEVSKGISVNTLKVKPKKVEVEKPEKLTFFEPGLIKAPEKPLTLGTKIPVLVNFEFLAANNAAIGDGLQKLLKQFKAEELAKSINQVITRVFVDAFSGLGEAIGNALSGVSIGDAFDGIIRSLAGGLKEIGKMIIQANVQLAILKKVGFSNPAVGIAVGIAITALGTLLQNSIGKRKAFASGTTALGAGTFATVGERGPENVFLPRGSSVQPNNEANAFGGGELTVRVVGAISGETIVLAAERASARLNRNN